MRVRVIAVSAMASLLLAGCAGSSAGPGDVTARSSQSLTEASLGTGWTQLPDGPLSPRWGATAVWADGTLLVFGGRDTDPCPPGADCALPVEPPLRDGARYDPKSQGWSAMAPLPVDLEYASTAVVDGHVYVWGHARPGEHWTTTFLAYDPKADEWEQLPLPTTTSLRGYELEPGDGEVLLSVGSHENGHRPDLRYQPEQRTFAELPADPLIPSFDRDLTVVGEQIVLTGIPITPSPGGADGPARYRAATWTGTDGWHELPPGDVIGHNPEWFAVDGELVNPTPGGSDGGQTNTYDRVYPYGGRLDPSTGQWSDLPEAPDPEPDPIRLYGVGDDRLLLSGYGLGLQPRDERWIQLGSPEQLPDQGVAGAVGDGRLYIFGGAHWESGTQARLSATTWLFTPPTDGS